MLYKVEGCCGRGEKRRGGGEGGGGRERKMIMGERGEWAILCWESGTFRFPFHLVSERFNCSKWLTPAHQRDRDGGRVTERMTLMDTRRGERGKESDRDRVKDIVREFNGEKEGSVLSFFLVGASVSAHWNATETALFLCGLTLLPGLDLRAPDVQFTPGSALNNSRLLLSFALPRHSYRMCARWFGRSRNSRSKSCAPESMAR